MVRLVIGVLCFLVGSSVHANLCKTTRNGGLNNPRYLGEAQALKDSRFSANGAGNQNYDATLIRCSRDRDSLAKKIEAFDLEKEFPQDLKPRIVRGKIKYMNAFGLPYGYQLSRTKGVWRVQAVLKFDFPTAEEIPVAKQALARIGKSCSTEYCTVKNNSRSRRAVMEMWRDEIERVWTLPGFEVDVRVKNLNEISGAALKKFEDKKAVWKINFSKKTPDKKRATYYPIPIIKERGISVAEDSTTLVHEFGHWMGLDDEYEEFDARTEKHQNLDCKTNGGDKYMMCDMYDSKVVVKPVYGWLITRRYVSEGPVKGMGRRCKKGENLGKYKKKTVCAFGLGISEGKCHKKDGVSSVQPGYCLLWHDKQKVYQARPLTGKEAKCERGKNLGTHKGKLICEKSGALTPEKCRSKKGRTDVVPYYCVYPDDEGYAGKLIECSKDDQCGAREYCDKGFAGIGTNRCKPKRDNKKVCTNKRQCLSGRCYAGLCANQDACKKDGDCSAKQYCDKGVLTVGVNKCVDQKENGKGCSRKGQCRSGRCYFGKCNVADACKKDKDCKNDQYCDKGVLSFGVNVCKAKRKKGKGCSRKAQCKSNKCLIKCK